MFQRGLRAICLGVTRRNSPRPTMVLAATKLTTVRSLSPPMTVPGKSKSAPRRSSNLEIAYLAVAVGTLLLAIHDGHFTSRRIRTFGPSVELNPAVRSWHRHLGVTGIYAAIILPTLGLVTMALSFHLPLLLGAVAGVRGCLFNFQLDSSSLEREMLGVLRTARLGTPPPSRGDF